MGTKALVSFIVCGVLIVAGVAWPRGNHATPEEAQRHAALSTPMKRIGKVEQVVATVLWLCSDHASFITGATVPIDSGQQAGLKLSRMYRPGQPMKAAES